MKTILKKITLIAIVFLAFSCSNDDINEVEEKAAFKMVFETTVASDVITIPTNSTSGVYDYSVDWGDGKTNDNVTGNIAHTYSESGTFTVAITGDFPAIYFNNAGTDLNKLKEVSQWGNIQWQSMNGAFRFCKQLNITATDTPDLSQVTDMSYMFDNNYALTASLNNWDVSNVTKMAYLFAGATHFNQPLNLWDVSKVTDMNQMFLQASNFSQDLSGWNTVNVTICYDFNRLSSLTSVQLPTLGCF